MTTGFIFAAAAAALLLGIPLAVRVRRAEHPKFRAEPPAAHTATDHTDQEKSI